MIDAIILCGGKGERLRPVLSDRPKSLAPVAGRPLLEWLVLELKNQEFGRIVLATGFMGDAVEAALGDGRRFGVELVYSHETEARGTGGAVRLAAERTRSDPVLVLNGDSYCRFQVSRMLARHRQRRAAATLWLQESPESARFGAVQLAADGQVVRFLEKGSEEPRRGASALISCGVYLLSRALIAEIPARGQVSLERDVFAGLAGQGAYGVVGSGVFTDIGTPQSLAKADNLLKEEFRLVELRRKQIEEAQAYLTESLAVQRRSFAGCVTQLVDAANAAAESLKAGGKILLCGNGGSAADCQHVATELVGRLSKQLTRPAMAAIALTTDTSFLTAYANDVGFEGIFARQVEALGRPGDVLIGISTSGRSANVARAVEMARGRQMITIALVGEGGSLGEAVEHAIVVPDRDTQHIQETMLPLEHLLCLLIEDALHGAGAGASRQL
jgi:phosphoheptose isomerase/UTP-glucose-1-phosphate uridylyltransferase